MSSWISVHKPRVRVFKPVVKEEKNEISNDITKPVIETNYPINVKYYISGGKLGDFIHQLSVIKYNYDFFGKKGVLYLADIGDKFSMGLERTYNETKDIVLKQDYILDYQIYNNQRTDINLSNWRKNIVNNIGLNWKQIFRKTYDIDWANTRWLNNIEKDNSLHNTILITHSTVRYNNKINFDIIHNLIEQNEKIYFICFDIMEYNEFISKYNISLPLILCKNVTEMISKIDACKLLVGNLSSPLALAFSLHKDCIGILPSNVELDINLNTKLNLPFYTAVNDNDELHEAINNKLRK